MNMTHILASITPEPVVTEWGLYWLTRLDGIQCLLSTGCVVLGVATIVALIFADDVTLSGSEQRLMRRLPVFGLPACVLLAVAATLTPTTKEMAAIIVIPKVANSEQVQGLGEGVVDLAEAWLDELRPKGGDGDAE